VEASTILLDVDGTLLDTREFVFAGFEHALRTLEAPVPSRAELAASVGPPLEAIYAQWVGAEHAVALAREHRAFQVRSMHLVVAYEGALETLSSLRVRGLRLAAVTSRSRSTSVASLDRVGMLGALEAVISAEDAVALKPDPRHLQAALDSLGVGAQGVVMVGDTSADIDGGRNIGALTVAALYGFHGEAVLAANPDRTIRDIRELPRAIGM
jgi:HAD superfamily hydrolase (TIGR01549 family)